MFLNSVKIISLLLLSLNMFSSSLHAQDQIDEKHIEVSLRMIGHQVLLNANDSISLVLPISKEKEQYKLSFDTEFEFNPEEMVATIDQIIKDTKLAKGYVLEVENCQSGEVVYSYKMSELEDDDIIPCKTRDQPIACYNLLFTLLNPKKMQIGDSESNLEIASSSGSNLVFYLSLSLIFILLAVFLRKKRKALAIDDKKELVADTHFISLGNFQFDQINTALILNEQRIELTGKESNLLSLLNDSVNNTVERDVILNVVWGDEGDYIGRTLDVFISKLRKKLEGDDSVKIINTRGVGYRLVIV